MKATDFLPFLGLLVGMIWASTVHGRCRKTLLRAYSEENTQPNFSNLTLRGGGAWSIFTPLPDDSQKMIELKASLMNEANSKLKYNVIVTVSLVVLLTAVSSLLAKHP